MTMTCTRCGQRSDWIGEGSDWRSPDDERAQAVAVAIYECENCGHTQRVR